MQEENGKETTLSGDEAKDFHKSLDEFDDKCTCKLLKEMKEILEKMKKRHSNPIDLNEFYRLFERYLRTRSEKIVWEDIKSPKDKIIQYSDIPDPSEKSKELVKKLAVLKLNGGLGTTMGCNGPKSAITIKDGKNFIDLVVKQMRYLNTKYDIEVPLILMNSFNTECMTEKIVFRYDGIRKFSQSKFPRISSETLLPVSSSYGDKGMYPPGHGDLFYSLKNSGMLEELLNEGYEYLFVSNIDNLASTVDLKLLEYFATNNLGFLMEVTDKTRADVKGGTLIEYKGALRLLEIAQVPSNKKSEFTNFRKFTIFNTNNIWINLKDMKKKLEEGFFDLDIIENKKTLGKETVIQLETAIGSAIKYFPNSCGIVVPRSRFLPVKTCSDLFLVESNLFVEKNGTLQLHPSRVPRACPVVKLEGENFSKIESYEKCFKGIPDILELDHLTVSGNITFGKNVVLKGTIIVLVDEKKEIYVPDGSVLEDEILHGHLPRREL
ncbi:UTP glucose 1 phosphate uridyltransferase 1 [Encephalitozoon intestinalis ATCC 50506]|uniref:UTP--glucose-1-phosphate uridylyltransferase n=1 Tax=Encephalitozoon intestinalis (strain ATCC 50506) TaxID=876142 RepID=E0S628_ENCIT|nr:UTP glucose 1 phosphate uridyltransferase 1 [Encephalitozoon intestinalis ATCC 50506]ADM11163.1 UTP glucose 1 phosphate uridyltransferase 1 [Encephalitozoon intestinalis ATCC 50506]UTX44829.1 UTP glucose 1 phosphate uridyltransferase 1 [Encephalitozoon intestinalis]